MTRRRALDPRRAKIHFNYTVAQVADRFGVSRGTVYNWIKSGLQVIRVRGIILILGDELRAFLNDRKAKRRIRCPPGTMLCFKCRAPRSPAEGLIEVMPRGAAGANLCGICPRCDTLMYRQANKSQMAAFGVEVRNDHGSATALSG